MRWERHLVLLAALFVLGCGSSGGTAPVKYGHDIVVGVPLAASGNLAVEGAMARQGYDLWLDWVNRVRGGIEVAGVRHRVRLVYQDDGSAPEADARLTGKMIADGAHLLLGPYGASNVAAAAGVADAHRVPLVSANGSASSIFGRGYRYVFGVQTPAARGLDVVLDMAAALQPRPATVAMLSADDPFSQEVARAAVDHATARGFQVVANLQYPAGSTSLSGLVTEAKAGNPDVVIDSGHLLEAVAVSKAVKDLRLSAKLLAFTVGPTVPDFVKSLGPDADYVVTESQWTPAARYRPDYYLTTAQYVAAYHAKYRTADDPDYQVADATAAGVALGRAIELAGSLDPEKVRAALASLDLVTFFGRIRFDANGQNVYKPMLVEQIQNGRRQTVWPVELAGARALYPTPTWAVRTGTPDPTPQPAMLPATGAPS